MGNLLRCNRVRTGGIAAARLRADAVRSPRLHGHARRRRFERSPGQPGARGQSLYRARASQHRPGAESRGFYTRRLLAHPAPQSGTWMIERSLTRATLACDEVTRAHRNERPDLPRQTCPSSGRYVRCLRLAGARDRDARARWQLPTPGVLVPEILRGIRGSTYPKSVTARMHCCMRAVGCLPHRGGESASELRLRRSDGCAWRASPWRGRGGRRGARGRPTTGGTG
jgi:hypothetical protein